MPLSADDIRRAFEALSDELARRRQSGEIVIVGGAALVLLFQARESTKDVDAYFVRPEASIAREAAEAVASRMELPVDWLNDSAKGPSFSLSTSTRRRMLSMICGRRCMDVHELVQALLTGDLPAARQYVADAQRTHLQWERLEPPRGLSPREMSVAAGVVELLASRSGSAPPAWTSKIGAAPEPLRKRNLIALPDFLDVA